jgi:hypothetical protein
MKTFKVDIDFKGHASFSSTVSVADEKQAVQIVRLLAASNGFNGTVKKVMAREVVEVTA